MQMGQQLLEIFPRCWDVTDGRVRIGLGCRSCVLYMFGMSKLKILGDRMEICDNLAAGLPTVDWQWFSTQLHLTV